MERVIGAKRERLLQRVEERYGKLAQEVHEGHRTSILPLRRTGRLLNNLGFGHRISEIAADAVAKPR